MNKAQFMTELSDRLTGLPESDLNERLLFYSEMIDDRMEDGISEEEAVAGVGSVDEIVEQIMAEIPLSKLLKEKVRKRNGMKAWEIILLVLGFPLWFPLLAAAFAICLSLYIVLWAVLISLWAVDLSVAVCAPAALIMAIYFLVKGNTEGALLMLGAAILCAGLAVLLFVACKAMTVGLIKLTKKMFVGIKRMFVGKERAES